VRALVLVLLVGCTSYKADVQTICDAPRVSGVDRTTEEDKTGFLFKWSGYNIHTPEGKGLLKTIEDAPKAERLPKLKAAMEATGVRRCAMTEWLEKDAR
jgi:hypothetical protein